MVDPKFSILLGAGASKDAGLPDAFELTNEVYKDLLKRKSEQAKLFAIVVSKLILRNARKGGSPFARVNIEDVYDALKRLVNRDQDPLAEFVAGWDASLLGVTGRIDAEKIIRSVLSSATIANDRRLDRGSSLKIDNWKLGRAAEELEAAFNSGTDELRGASLEPFLETLIRLLDVEEAPTNYLEEFLIRHADKAQCLATLNYDLLVEAALTKSGRKYDLGLTKWNDFRYVRFHGRALKLMKLHGSTNWVLRNDDEIVFSEDVKGRFMRKGMIFGGQSDKLVPHGPFLHLRHEFYKAMRQSSYLLVIGYSYGDIHLNALIRSWVSTRKNGKLINVDPGGFRGSHDIYRGMLEFDKDGNLKKRRIEIKEIKKGFAEALDDISEALSTPPEFAPT